MRVEYYNKYYNENRVTPIFISNDDLLSLTFEGFHGLVLKEVPHLKKISSEAVALRMTFVDDNNSEVDISTKYFSSQMFSFLNKGIISVRVAVAESPVAFSNTSVSAGKERKSDEISIINTTPEYSPTSKQESPRIALPLERYAEVVQNYSDELKSNTKELKDFDFKLQKACDQNR
ncbi:Hypothetical predicted protein [Paramuricea clavata]|uniref:Uncharacterized protein n=1 Tax=Paramuricea clavata TaxID=317549 RepID=A0A6S7FI24_PARCT|nr:Hypothetical predicted protein [Paramuricea clavata]